jgi:hypothetical protein
MHQFVVTCIGMLAIAAGQTAPAPSTNTASSGLGWDQRPGAVALMRNGTAVWQFNYGTNQPKPFFHPVALPGGPVLTVDRPADHAWHHALWFAWKFINDVNYWEPAAGATQSEGRTEWDEARVDTRPDYSARIAMDLRYRPAGKDPVLTEQRLVEISAPDKQGMYYQDWTLNFTAAGKDVVLSRTPIPGEPEGVPWGGYAGLSVRLNNALAEAQAVTTEGPIAFSGGTYRGKALAMDYSGIIAQREVGMAILDHPANLNSPSPWYAIKDNPMRYFSPAVLCFAPHTIKAGQSLRLRYRVMVHPGRWDAAKLRLVSAEYGQRVAPK